MSIYNELIPKINELTNTYSKNMKEDLQNALDCFDKFEKEFKNERNRGRETVKIRMTTLQSIKEDNDANKDAEPNRSTKSNSGAQHASTDSNDKTRATKKRSKNEVDDMFSPEVDKRPKRNASIKAQSNITKQVNVNLTAKLRRENSSDNVEKNIVKTEKTSRSLKQKGDKENAEPNLPVIQIKEEKVSLPPEPMDMDALPLNIPVKKEVEKDDIAMPPPAMPVPKPRKGIAKEKSEDSNDEETGKKRPTRTKKQTEAMPPPAPPVAGTRATRASSRATRKTESEEQLPEARPKRTRAKKKVSAVESQSIEVNNTQTSESVSATALPDENQRPKRTRRGKAAEKVEPPGPVEQITPNEGRTSLPTSPILQKKTKSKKKDKNDLTIESTISINSMVDKTDGLLEETRVIATDKTTIISKDMDKTTVISKDMDKTIVISKEMDKTTVISKEMDKTTVISKEMDKTVVLSNEVVNHAPVMPKNHNMKETVVTEKCNNETFVVEKQQNPIMDATVVIDKGIKPSNLTDDNSLLTDDESYHQVNTTPPKKEIPVTQPSSAVKEKVQQFEEMATRVTRTKTRAMAKKDDVDNLTPPDKVSKPILSAETLKKMNNLIFNGKPRQISSSASKPRAPASVGKSMIPSSTSKLSSISKHREAAEERVSRVNEEDAKRKKEAMLEAKRELQRRKREEKIAAAAAARNNAEKERQAQLELAAKERMEKQAHADAGKLERMKEAERKKLELARKVQETEERRRAEETSRLQRLADEQRRVMLQRRKQLEEQEAMKKEAAIMAKEIEKRQKEYIEKQKMKSRLEDKMQTPLKTPGTPGNYMSHIEPVYMADGFQYLNSDEDEESPSIPGPVPEWSTSKARKQQLDIQSHISSTHIDRLFSVRVHSPDLRDIFPLIERARLKRTSSAVWRTPPQLATLRE